MRCKLEDLSLEKCLGSGFFGEVWRARIVADGDNGTLYAVKKVKLSLIVENQLMDQLRREVKILYALDHPRIVRLHFDFDDGKHMYLGMAFAAGGTLFERLTAAGKFTPEVASRYFRETCEALDYLHHLPEKVIHRDIKPENILLDGEDQIKLADFGWANMMETGKRDTFCGTLDYLPPEMIMGSGHDESVDMWNMGVLLYEMTTGQSPFSSSSKEQTCRLILNVDLRFPVDVDEGAKDLVSKLCKRKPKDRLDVTAALEHSFVLRFAPAAKPLDASKGNPPKAVVEVTGEEDWSRPSVAARRLRDERTKICVEMSLLVEAKRGTEEALMKLSEDLEQQRAAISEERKRRLEADAACVEMEKSVQARDVELEELRKKADTLQVEVTRLAARDRGTGLGWVSRRAAGRAATAAEAAAAAAAAAAGNPPTAAEAA